MTTIRGRLGLALGAGLLTAALAVPALADIKDFEFQLVQNEVKQGD